LHFFFSGAFRVSRVQRCEKVKNPKPKWHFGICLFRNFSGVFSGFSGLST
jgi:hypothetical protein